MVLNEARHKVERFSFRSAVTTMLSVFIFFHFLSYFHVTHSVPQQYTSIFNFGNSLSDTGNLHILNAAAGPSVPYGMTFFHRPAGRFSDGRLIIDFIGIPILIGYK